MGRLPSGPAPLVPADAVERLRRPEVRTDDGPGEIGLERAEECLRQLDPTRFRDHDRWLEVMMAFHSAAGGGAEEREAFVEWSTSDEDYADHADGIRPRWESLRADRAGGVTTATLFHRVVEAGGTVPHAPAKEDFEPVEPAERGDADGVGPQDPGLLRLGGNGLTDLGNAARFAREHRGHLRYVEELRAWVAWDGRRWSHDLGLRAVDRAAETVKRMQRAAFEITNEDARTAALKGALQSHSRSKLDAAIALARAPLRASVVDLDADHLVLNVQNTLDLRTHDLRAHDPDDLLAKVTAAPYDRGARCPLWEVFLERVLPDAAVRAFFQRLMGYALQGGQDAKLFAVVVGPGDSGKSTALGAIADALGHPTKGDGGASGASRHYCATTAFETFGRY